MKESSHDSRPYFIVTCTCFGIHVEHLIMIFIQIIVYIVTNVNVIAFQRMIIDDTGGNCSPT